MTSTVAYSRFPLIHLFTHVFCTRSPGGAAANPSVLCDLRETFFLSYIIISEKNLHPLADAFMHYNPFIDIFPTTLILSRGHQGEQQPIPVDLSHQCPSPSQLTVSIHLSL